MADQRLILCVPSKGSLSEGTIDLFQRCLISVKRIRGARSYEARLEGVDDVDVQLVRPADIPTMIDDGQAHVGITGLDLVKEHQGEGTSKVKEVVSDLGFGSADLVVGVPRAWLDVSTFDDLIEVAQDIRHRHSRSLRVATKFPNLAREHFRDKGFVDFRLVESLGATEGAPRAGQADIIVDLTSTGTTLDTNGLKQIDGGLVLRSQACLVASGRDDAWDDARLATLAKIVMLLEASLTAHRQRLVRARFDAGRPPALERALVEGLMVESTWSETTSGVELAGRAEVRKVPTLLAALEAAGSSLSSIDEPSLVVAASTSMQRFEAHLGRS